MSRWWTFAVPLPVDLYEGLTSEARDEMTDQLWQDQCERQGLEVGEYRAVWGLSPEYPDIVTGRTVGPFWVRRYEMEVPGESHP
jgi:hypothetical protein